MEEIDSQMNVDRNLVALIEKLKPKYKIGFLSNAGREEIEPIFRDKIDRLFDSTAVSYEVGVVKPDAQIFLVSAQRLGVEPEECLFVDDSMTNIDGANGVGMKTLFYPTFGEIPPVLSDMAVH
jgi:HAD superfamily hydrolase (TIGR01509 family)